MKASIIIRTYNEEKHIGRLLKGIRQQNTDFSHETILVDSGSTDDTTRIARTFPVEIVKIKPSNFSFGYSLNTGIEKARGEFCVFISAHCYPNTKHWLQNLLSPFEDDEIALVYGKQRGNQITRFSEHQIFRQWFPEESTHRQEHPFCNNANLAIRRELWEQQKYNEDLTGLEDLDWAKRIREKGYYLSYAADAPIIHVHDESPADIYNRYEREAIAYKTIFPGQTFSFVEFLKLFLLNTFSDYYQAIKKHVFLKNIWDIPMFRFMQFWGTYKGYKKETEQVTKKLRERYYYPNTTGHDEPVDSEQESLIQTSETTD